MIMRLAPIATVLATGAVQRKIRSASLLGAGYAVAAVFALFALGYLLYAVHAGLAMATGPIWAALILVILLLGLAGIAVAVGGTMARRVERESVARNAPAAIATPAALAVAPRLLGILRRHPLQLVVLALVAGTLLEITRSRR